MFNVKAIREQIADLESKALAIQTLVNEEKREPSADEIAELDKIQGHGESKGLLGKLSADLDRAIRLEKIQGEKAKEKFTAPGASGQSPRIETPSIRGKLKSFTGPTAARDAFTTGQFLKASLFGSESAKQWLTENGLPLRRDVQNAHSTGDNTKGGYLVPEVTENTIIRLIEEFGTFRRNVGRVWPVMGSTKVPKRAGGFTVYHTGENETITASDLALAQVELTPKKASVLTQLSNELSEDALSVLGDLLVQEFAYAFAYDEDDAGFNGDGTEPYNKIVGLKNALAAGSIFNASGGKTSILNLTIQDWASVQAKARRYRGFNPKWYVHSEVYYGAMVGLMAASGGNTIQTLANGDSQPIFLGKPVEFVELLENNLGTKATTIFGYYGDLSQAVEMGDARGVTIASDSSVYFKEDALGVRGTQRYDIVVHGTGTASRADSMVAIKTA
jgi:HK97 family phage major capsid protein